LGRRKGGEIAGVGVADLVGACSAPVGGVGGGEESGGPVDQVLSSFAFGEFRDSGGGWAQPLLGSRIASGAQTIPASSSTFTRRSVAQFIKSVLSHMWILCEPFRWEASHVV